METELHAIYWTFVKNIVCVVSKNGFYYTIHVLYIGKKLFNKKC